VLVSLVFGAEWVRFLIWDSFGFVLVILFVPLLVLSVDEICAEVVPWEETKNMIKCV